MVVELLREPNADPSITHHSHVEFLVVRYCACVSRNKQLTNWLFYRKPPVLKLCTPNGRVITQFQYGSDLPTLFYNADSVLQGKLSSNISVLTTSSDQFNLLKY